MTARDTTYRVTVDVHYVEPLTRAQVVDRVYGALIARSESDGLNTASVVSAIGID